MNKRHLLPAACLLSSILSGQDFKAELAGTYVTNVFNRGAAEIVAHDPKTQRLYVVNADLPGVDILDISKGGNPIANARIYISPTYGRSANSVAFRDGVLAVAIEAARKTDPGSVVFYDANGTFLSGVTVGALPDMLTFSPDGKKVLVANEGEPSDDYTVDPEGSISIIDLSRGAGAVTQADVKTAGFGDFTAALLDPAIRIFGPKATIAQDLEPEYIAVSADSKTAWVTLQEANAIAIVDVNAAKVTKIVPLGFKDHSKAGNGFDASDRDGGVNVKTWPVFGMYQPDAISAYQVGGKTYLVTANEGDTRAWTGLNEERRVSALTLDATAFPTGADLKRNENLGRLTVSTVNADTDRDGDIDRLYLPGARSFSIWDADGKLVWDSGDQLEKKLAELLPKDFNSSHDEGNSFDTRSDNKGPEPEGLAVAQLNGRWYAFIGLERMSGIMVYDISDPMSPKYVSYINPRKFEGDPTKGTAGDLGPEGLLLVMAADSPLKQPTLIVANEVSGSTSMFKLTPLTAPVALQARITPAITTTDSRELVLDGSPSTGSGLTYSWKASGKSAAITPRDLNTYKINVQFAEGYGEYSFELTVKDSTGATSTTSTKILYVGQ